MVKVSSLLVPMARLESSLDHPGMIQPPGPDGPNTFDLNFKLAAACPSCPTAALTLHWAPVFTVTPESVLLNQLVTPSHGCPAEP